MGHIWTILKYGRSAMFKSTSRANKKPNRLL